MRKVSKRVLGALVAGMLIVSPLSTVAPAITASAAKTLPTDPSDRKDVGWYNGYHHDCEAFIPNSFAVLLHGNDGGFSTSWECGPYASSGLFFAHRGLCWG